MVGLQGPPQGLSGGQAGHRCPHALHLPTRPHCPGMPPRHLEVVVDQEVAANEVEVAQLALELGLDGQEAVGHDLLHLLLWWAGRAAGSLWAPLLPGPSHGHTPRRQASWCLTGKSTSALTCALTCALTGRATLPAHMFALLQPETRSLSFHSFHRRGALAVWRVPGARSVCPGTDPSPQGRQHM